MSHTIISVENLGKCYQIGNNQHHGYKALRDVISHKTKNIFKGQFNQLQSDIKEDFWALKDINFEIKRGDAVGIIGRNGAGKSTLLKLLSRITEPTTGRITLNGRVASLLEVGTGFHSELTGRENIFLNGAILGMRHKEIKDKFDEIVDFSGVEKFLDTPVKRYSSGMYVRLAFAVAAHLEPEILIVDEVLAVGDAEFQKKCLGKMGEVSKDEGRTVLFVSHNMGSIQELCNKCILLKDGQLELYGSNETIIETYLGQEKKLSYKNTTSTKPVFVSSVFLDPVSLTQSDIAILLVEINSAIDCKLSFDIRLLDIMGAPVGFGSIGTLDYSQKITIEKGENNLKIGLDTSSLALGKYSISIDLTNPNITYYDRCEQCIFFEVIRSNSDDRRMNQGWRYGSVRVPIFLLNNKLIN